MRNWNESNVANFELRGFRRMCKTEIRGRTGIRTASAGTKAAVASDSSVDRWYRQQLSQSAWESDVAVAGSGHV